MPSKLTKPLTRRMAIITDNRREPRRQDFWNVTIDPCGVFQFQRRGELLEMPIAHVLLQAQRAKVDASRKSKRNGRANNARG